MLLEDWTAGGGGGIEPMVGEEVESSEVGCTPPRHQLSRLIVFRLIETLIGCSIASFRVSLLRVHFLDGCEKAPIGKLKMGVTGVMYALLRGLPKWFPGTLLNGSVHLAYRYGILEVLRNAHTVWFAGFSRAGPALPGPPTPPLTPFRRFTAREPLPDYPERIVLSPAVIICSRNFSAYRLENDQSGFCSLT